ncbi:hypothetical protein Csa_017419 [Cucumis sativus]|uniref:Uncharacterized protein n=1 Tax=Cucumis sativus TaxID=3659 RepID=A0A0A0LDL5_CUCSA|nr:hypothetical protein Csa_017419 [Cucumis sativus]
MILRRLKAHASGEATWGLLAYVSVKASTFSQVLACLCHQPLQRRAPKLDGNMIEGFTGLSWSPNDKRLVKPDSKN